MPAGIWRRRRLAPHHTAGYAGRAFLMRPAERFECSGFENLSVICFANATVSLRLGHGAGLTAHRAVIQHRAAASLPCTGEASRCGGDFSPSHGSRRASPLLVEGAFAGGQGRTPLQGLLFQIAVQGLGQFAGKERNQVFNLPPAHEISVQHHTLSLWIAKLFDLHVEIPPAVISEFSGRSRSGRRRGPMLWCGGRGTSGAGRRS